MTAITINDLAVTRELDADAMGGISGGLTADLQHRLNQFGAQLNASAQIVFNPYYQYYMIRSAQIAHRSIYGRQMPNPFPPFRW